MAVTTSAFAEETVWLEGGVVPAEALSVDSESIGALTLKDTATGVILSCEGLNEGTVGPGAKDSITKITSLGGANLVPCTFVAKGPCESSSPPSAEAVNLPWLTELLLVGGKNLDDIVGTGGNAGWAAHCLVVGLNITDTCTKAETSADIDNTTEGDVVALFSAAIGGLANCTQGGAETGEVTGEVLILTLDGSSLAVSTTP